MDTKVSDIQYLAAQDELETLLHQLRIEKNKMSEIQHSYSLLFFGIRQNFFLHYTSWWSMILFIFMKMERN